MTAFAACLFAFAALTSVWIMAATWRRYGSGALALRAQLAACPESIVIFWKSTERRQQPALAPLRKGRAERPARRNLQAPGLEWPGAALAA